MKKGMAIATALLLALATVPARAEDPLVFDTVAKASVDADGTVRSVEPDPTLSAALQQLVKDKVAGFRFASPERGGRVVDGVTYVRLGGCALPEGGNYRLSLAYKDNGPRLVGGPRLPPPRYPPEAFQVGAEAEAKVTYVVETNGRARVENIDYAHPRQRQRRTFDKTIGAWIEGLRFEPEELAGQAVRTRIEVPVGFQLSDSSESYRKDTEEKRLRGSPECIAAERTPGVSDPVVLDSPFRPIPQT